MMQENPRRTVRHALRPWIALALGLAGLSSLTQAAVPARETALARARVVRDRVSRGDMSPLWSEFSDHLKTVLKDSVSFAAMSASIHTQVGAIDSVLSEEVTETDTSAVVKTRCRFRSMPVPGILTVGFTRDGRIGSLLVRPDLTNQPTEYPSRFLEYQPKARFELPFRGEWWVAWGGRTIEENQHAIIRAQRFAYDILMVKDGKTHVGDGKALTDYYCYGQEILAPAAGTVVAMADTFPDQPIGSRDPGHATGNHVVIDHGNGEFSLLAHLKPHSLRVKVGQKVKPGEVVGLTGNSGNTSEPHLHVHLMTRPSMDDGEGLPMPFSDYLLDGKVVEKGELRRFQLVKPHER